MPYRISSFVSCVLLLSGCATENRLESGLNSITQKEDKNVVFKAIGEPSSTLKIGGFTVYSWLVIDGKLSSENRVEPKSPSCVIRIIESERVSFPFSLFQSLYRYKSALELLRQVEPGVIHPKRIKDSFSEKTVKWNACNDFNEISQNIKPIQREQAIR